MKEFVIAILMISATVFVALACEVSSAPLRYFFFVMVAATSLAFFEQVDSYYRSKTNS